MVSANFSTVEDFCDAYRGRIYSLSGTDPLAPPLASLPNGGLLFHPNCLHALSAWVREFEGEAQYQARAVTDPRFLNISARVAQRRWKQIGKMEQGRLRHAPDKAAENAAMVA